MSIWIVTWDFVSWCFLLLFLLVKKDLHKHQNIQNYTRDRPILGETSSVGVFLKYLFYIVSKSMYSTCPPSAIFVRCSTAGVHLSTPSFQVPAVRSFLGGLVVVVPQKQSKTKQLASSEGSPRCCHQCSP